MSETGETRTYSSCWWLHDHLELGPNGEVHSCCYQYSLAPGDNRGSVELCRITGDRFPAGEIAAARTRVHREIVAGAHHDCNHCPILTTQAWEPRKYLTRSLTMNVWTHCNLKCRYCFIMAPGFTHGRVKYDLVAVIADMLAGEHLDPTGTVAWGGGDISALPEFNTLAGMFLDYGVYQNIKTSGFKFLRGVADVIAKKRGAVEVSLDAGTRETYASFKGRDAFDTVVENLGRYRERGAITLKYIAAKVNLSNRDIYGFLRLVEKLKPESVMVTPEYGDSWTGQYDAHLIRQIAKLIHLLKGTGIPVEPQSPEDIARVFPNFSAELKRDLAARRKLPQRLDLWLERVRERNGLMRETA